MGDDLPGDSLRDLDARMKRLRSEVEPPPGRAAGQPPGSGLGMAFLIATHLVSGVGVGAGIGYLLDRWLETSPWMLVVFFFLGSAAGMLNVYRVVSGAGLGVGYRPADRPTEPPPGGPNENGDEGPRG